MLEKLIIIGAGGYSKSVLDSVDKNKIQMTGFIDEYSNKNEHLGYPILSNNFHEFPNKSDYVYFIAIGNNKNRKRWFDILNSYNLKIINVIDNSAIVSANSKIGTGCFVGKMAIVNSGVEVGDNCIINTKSLLEHGCSISSNVNISTNTVLNGDVKVDEGSFIGSGSTVIGQLFIGSWSTIGAGAIVTKNIPDNVTAVGIPARVIKEGAILG